MENKEEWLACEMSLPYFIDNYCQIYDATVGGWIPFRLWDAQIEVTQELVDNHLVVILKARQLGLTWLVLGFILWLMVFHPAVTILIFSRREIEAIYLLDKRLKKMYEHLPEWMNVKSIVSDSSHIWELSNGSVAYAFPTSAGDSYTATLAFVDEADLVPNLDDLMLAVKPTIDGGGRMILLSRSDKETPNSAFKKLFQAAWTKANNKWKAIFLPWFVRPTRNQAWYEEQESEFLSRTGSKDGLYEQYPTTPEEALSPKSLNKRIPYEWLKRCYIPLQGERDDDLQMYTKYVEPLQYHSYIISADPAEGNPTSDDSSAHVFDATTLEECGVLVGKIEPVMFGNFLVQLAEMYNDASIMVERNNHGHAVIAQVRALEKESLLLQGLDGKYGWQETAKTKAYMYDTGSKLLRDGVPTIHSSSTFLQLTSIEGSSLKAPEGEFDDEAISYMLGLIAGSVKPPRSFGMKHSHASRHSSRLKSSRYRSVGRGV